MKWSRWIFILSYITLVNCKDTRLRLRAFCIALRNVSNFVQESRYIPVINFLEETVFLESTLLHALSEQEVSWTFFNFGRKTKLSQFYGYLYSTFVTLPSVDFFLNVYLNHNLPTQRYPKSVQIFVIFNEGKTDQLEKVEDLIGSLHVYYFLFEENGFIRLLTFVSFTPGKCDTKQLIEINKFDMTSMKWKTNVFKMEKAKNFHGCTLHIGFPIVDPEYKVDEVDYEKETIKCRGYLCRATEDISKILNFKYSSNAISKTETLNEKPIIEEIIFSDNKKFSLNWFLNDMSILDKFPHVPGFSKNGKKKFLPLKIFFIKSPPPIFHRNHCHPIFMRISD